MSYKLSVDWTVTLSIINFALGLLLELRLQIEQLLSLSVGVFRKPRVDRPLYPKGFVPGQAEKELQKPVRHLPLQAVPERTEFFDHLPQMHKPGHVRHPQVIDRTQVMRPDLVAAQGLRGQQPVRRFIESMTVF